jgi:replicative DNA helicase
MSLEKKILKHILNDDGYVRKTLPFIKPEYFTEASEKIVFNHAFDYYTKYNALPTVEALIIEIDAKKNISEDQYKKVLSLITEINSEEYSPQDTDWLVDQTEKFCQDKAIYNAIMQSITILDEHETSKLDKGAIPSILSDALGVSFDNHVGHDFIEDAESRYEFYHRVEERIPFDLDYLNRITKNGLPKKTLNIILAGTGVGKSLFMCHCAAANLTIGKNVLYITLEMAEERIAERIDANLLNVDVDKLVALPKDSYMKKIARMKEKSLGRLIIKEYPTASASATHFKHLLSELKLKRKFMPDIIYIDYLNICSSSRVKSGNNVNSYTLVKSIAEELRGLAVEFNVPIMSATQTTRGGYDNSDVGITDTSESFGLPATADFMIALISTEELAEMNQIMVKQLKNRYSNPDTNKRFVIGVDKAKMKLYDSEDNAQTNISDSGQVHDNRDTGPVFDKSAFGKRMTTQRDFSRVRV